MITSRERQILIMKANGLQSKQIAAALGIHRRTVEAHIASAKVKLGAKTTVHTVVMAIKRGLIGIGEIGVVMILCWACFGGSVDVRRGPNPPARISRTQRREA